MGTTVRGHLVAGVCTKSSSSLVFGVPHVADSVLCSHLPNAPHKHYEQLAPPVGGEQTTGNSRKAVDVPLVSAMRTISN